MRHATMPDVVVKLMEGRARVANGWCQGEWCVSRPEGVAYCAMGAVVSAARPYLRAALPTGSGTLPAYNDHPSRTQADILALFDRAIEGALR